MVNNVFKKDDEEIQSTRYEVRSTLTFYEELLLRTGC